MIHRVLIVAIGLNFATVGLAANWTQFAECGDSGHLHIYSYDPASVSTRRGKVLVGINVDYSRNPASEAQSGRMQWSLDCNARTYFERSRTDFRANRSVVAKYKKASEIMTIIPDSVADKLARKVCA